MLHVQMYMYTMPILLIRVGLSTGVSRNFFSRKIYFSGKNLKLMPQRLT